MVFKIDRLFCELTNRCNGNCIMCTHQFMKRPEKDMSVPMVKNILERIKPRAIIYHFFGEPLLYDYLGIVVSMASKKKIYSVIDTNAQLLTPSRFLYLSDCGLNKVIISFGAFTEKVYKSIWRNLAFNIVVSNIKAIYKLKKKYNLKTEIHIRIIVTEENKEQVIGTKLEWLGRPYDKLSFVDEFHLFGYDRIPFKKRDVPNCLERKRLNREMVIKSNGDIVLCCADLDGDYVMGNIIDDSIKNIYNGNKYNEFRNRIYNNINPPDICKECGVRPW